MVDTRDLKSLGQKRLCGFESRFEHQRTSQIVERWSAIFLCSVVIVWVKWCALWVLRLKNFVFAKIFLFISD